MFQQMAYYVLYLELHVRVQVGIAGAGIELILNTAKQGVKQMSHLIVSLRLSSLLMLVSTLLPGTAASAASIPHGTVDLVAENRWIAPGRQTYLGLNFQLEKGWHIYWINPGDSGQPPRVQWHLPDGLSVGEIEALAATDARMWSELASRIPSRLQRCSLRTY